MKPQRESRRASSKKKDSLKQLQREIENNMKAIYQKKSKIEELAKSTIEELIKFRDLDRKTKELQKKTSRKEKEKTMTPTTVKARIPSNKNNNRFELDYELTNMKMIRKILELSTAFEEHQCEQRKEKFGSTGLETNSAKKILIIEDDLTTIKIISHLLVQNNFSVEFSQDAEEGLRKVFKEKPDLILLDIMLPGMDGFQLLTKLKATRETSHIPVIILSSLADERNVIKGLEKGASDYILKPFSPQILFFKIKKTLALNNEYLTDYRHL
jgi:PleD family two-component response regulator